MNLTRGIDMRKIAELMPGASGAEVKVLAGLMCVSVCVQRVRENVCHHCLLSLSQGVCTEAGMYALRERRVHVTQEDCEMAVAKVFTCKYFDMYTGLVNGTDIARNDKDANINRVGGCSKFRYTSPTPIPSS